MVSVPILLTTVDRRAFSLRLTDFEAIEAVSSQLYGCLPPPEKTRNPLGQ